MAEPVVTINLKGDPSQLNGVLSRVQSDLRGMGGRTQANTQSMRKMGSVGAVAITKMLAPLAAAAAGFFSVRAAIRAVTGSISKAAKFEELETSFVTLLGSAEAARDRMAELAEFGKTTPFNLQEVVKANRQLEVFTGGALSGKEGMTLLGDAAAVSGKPINELSMWVGRLYDGLQSGRPVGEAMMRLQELAVVSGKTRSRIEELQKQGKDKEAWEAMEAALGRFSGEMDRRSSTWNGMMSNLQDGIDLVKTKFGTPIKDVLKPVLADLIELTGNAAEAAGEWGAKMAVAIQTAINLFKNGEIGDFMAQMLLAAGEKFINFLVRSLLQNLAGMGNVIVSNIRFSINLLKDGLIKTAHTFGSILLQAISDVLAKIPTMGDAAKKTQDMATAAYDKAADIDLGLTDLDGHIKRISDAYMEGRKSLEGFDAIGSTQQDLLKSLFKSMQGAASSQIALAAAEQKKAEEESAPSKQPKPDTGGDDSGGGSNRKIVTDSLQAVGGGGYVFGGISKEDRRTQQIEEQTRAIKSQETQFKRMMGLMQRNNFIQEMILSKTGSGSDGIEVVGTN